jgi:hypothetical protein
LSYEIILQFLLPLGGLHLSMTIEDRQVLFNVGVEGILLLQQLMGHHLIVDVHVNESTTKIANQTSDGDI